MSGWKLKLLKSLHECSNLNSELVVRLVGADTFGDKTLAFYILTPFCKLILNISILPDGRKNNRKISKSKAHRKF